MGKGESPAIRLLLKNESYSKQFGKFKFRDCRAFVSFATGHYCALCRGSSQEKPHAKSEEALQVKQLSIWRPSMIKHN
jgi:hypothetical protein